MSAGHIRPVQTSPDAVPAAASGAGVLPVLGVVGAIDAEVRLLREHLVDAEDVRWGHLTLSRGWLDVDAGRRQPLVLTRCGVGKVNAALAASALSVLGVQQAVFSGVAGSLAPDLGVGDLLVASDLVQHDVDVTALGRRPGELLGEPASWSADPGLSADLLSAAQDVVAARGGARTCRVGRIASGDQFVASRERAASLRQVFGADCAEMEGAAFAQACTSLGIVCAVVRTMSDSSDGDAPADFPAFLTEASRVGLEIISALVGHRLRGGGATPPHATSRSDARGVPVDGSTP